MTRKAILLLICMGWLLQVAAQQEFFIFIQHDKNQPFYVRIGDRTSSSSALGHVILSKLKDSTYTLNIGFPNNQFPEQEYSVHLNKKDRGFELKNMAEKGWTLFDMQSMELISPAKSARNSSGGGVAYVKRNDDFARLMSGVVNDTAVLYVSTVIEKKPAVTRKADTVSTEVTNVTKSVSTEQAGVAKKTDTVSTDLANTEKKSETVSTESANVHKKTDSAVTELTDVSQKADSTSGELTSAFKKTDTVSTDLTAASKKTETPAGETPKTDDVSKGVKVKPESINDSVFNPPALGVITVVKQFATDTGFHMVVVDDKDSVNIFIPGDANEVAKSDKPGVKAGEDKAAAKNNDPDTKANANNQNADKTVDVSKPPVQENQSVKQENKQDAKQENKVAVSDNKSANQDNKPVESKVITPDNKTSDQNNTVSKENSAKTGTDPVAQRAGDDTSKKSTKLVMINSDCRSFATSNDVDKLRVKMVEEKDTESRLAAARKVFKTKCFSASQVKALSELFPYDEQKYQFLEAAYPFVSDTSAFKELGSLLDDPAYVQRFRKLVRLD